MADPDADRRLVALVDAVAVNADREAFSELFRAFAPKLKTFYLRQGVPAASAEELVQEAMLTLWRRAASYRPESGRVTTWVYTIARNLGIDRLRKERRPDGAVVLEDLECPQPACDDQVETSRQGDRLRRALKTLPPDQSQVLSLYYFQLKTTSEIASELGIPGGTVKSRMRLALERLRKLVQE